MQLIIAGFHRSGTSLLTQLLHAGGLFVGDDLLGAKPSNPYGHFEDRKVLQIHRAILESHGDDWQWDAPFPHYIGIDQWKAMRRLTKQREAKHRVWGFKDPRVCLFMGAWQYVLPEPRFVIVYRDPGECVRSMESRQAQDLFNGEGTAKKHRRFFSEPDHGLKLWDTYNRPLVAFARRNPEQCVVMPFTHLTEGFEVISHLNQRFGVGLEEVDTSSVFDPSVTSRRGTAQRYHDPQVAARVIETWEALESLAKESESSWNH